MSDLVLVDVEALESMHTDLLEVEAYVRNALEALEEARSMVIDHLTLPSDAYTRANILLDLDTVENNLRKALG